MSQLEHPVLIQGGMGVAVSSWNLAQAVAKLGQLGVVSGTALDTVLVRRLQLGDPGEHIRRAMLEFPFPEMCTPILHRYFRLGGKSSTEPFVALPMLTERPSQERQELIAVANFVEVYLAKEHHDGLVGINFLEKIQLPILPSLFGAMLAGVDYVLIGAGIPITIPGILDRLSEGEQIEMPLKVVGTSVSAVHHVSFDPEVFTGGRVPWLRRPAFFPIVASVSLATMLKRKSNGRIDGFVVEGPTAGGHNAPPRGTPHYNADGEPIYGVRDQVNCAEMVQLGLPFWLAGSYGSAKQVDTALQQGAAGVQVGTAFAFCDESGMRQEIRRQVIRQAKQRALQVRTDPLASPAGFPFKVLSLENTVADPQKYAMRKRVCDLGFLRQGYQRENGSLGWRCPAEPIAQYIWKGGMECETAGKKCLCNGLMANVGLAQSQKSGEEELPLVTCGDDVQSIVDFLPSPDAEHYSAADVITRLLASSGSQEREEEQVVRYEGCRE